MPGSDFAEMLPEEHCIARFDAGLDVMDYDDQWGRYRICLSPGDLKKHVDVIAEVLAQAFKDSIA